MAIAIAIVFSSGVVAAIGLIEERPSNGVGEGDGRSLRVAHDSPVQKAIDAKCEHGGVVELSGLYQTPGTVLLEGCRGVTIMGPAVFDGDQPDRLRYERHVAIRNSSDILIENITIRGTRCPAPPCQGDSDPAFNERQHAFEIAASDRVELRGVTGTNVWGDGVYVTAKTFDGSPEQPPKDIVIRDAYFANTGRQGIAASGVDGLLVERTVLREVGYSAFDFEAESGGASRFSAVGNTMFGTGNGTLNVTCDQGSDGTLLNRGPFLLTGNKVYGETLDVNPLGCALPAGVVILNDNVDSLPIEQAPTGP